MIADDYADIRMRAPRRHPCILSDCSALWCECPQGVPCAEAVRRCTTPPPRDPLAAIGHHCERLGIFAFWRRR
jgi:hypothetical protein